MYGGAACDLRATNGCRCDFHGRPRMCRTSRRRRHPGLGSAPNRRQENSNSYACVRRNWRRTRTCCGSRALARTESNGYALLRDGGGPIDANFKKAMVENDERATDLIFRTYKNTLRVTRNAISQQALAIEREGRPFEDLAHLVKGARGLEGFINGDINHGIWCAGPVQGLIEDIPSVKVLIERIVARPSRLSGCALKACWHRWARGLTLTRQLVERIFPTNIAYKPPATFAARRTADHERSISLIEESKLS